MLAEIQHSPVFTTEHLTPQNQHALCDHFHLPTPTPDVPIDRLLEAAGLTLQSAYDALRCTTDVRLMIAAAAIRGGVAELRPGARVTVSRLPDGSQFSRLPPDPRLSPAPMPKLSHAAPRPDSSRSTAGSDRSVDLSSPWTAPGSVVVSVAPNPKRPGSASHVRYAAYRRGATAADLRAAGLTIADFRWDRERGYVTWTAAPTPASNAGEPASNAQATAPDAAGNAGRPASNPDETAS